MKTTLFLVAALGSLLMLFSVSPSGAADTSPYLFGTWEEYTLTLPITQNVTTRWDIVNPTSSDIRFCCCLYDSGGTLDSGCVHYELRPNARDRSFLAPNGTDGVVKCIAFPSDRWTFDPNVVIGGKLTRKKVIGALNSTDPEAVFYAEIDSNLAAVVVNSKTLPEFNRVMQDCRDR
jgi:hypothetical protein